MATRRSMLKSGSMGSTRGGLLPRTKKQTAKLRRISTGYGIDWKIVADAVRKRDGFKCQMKRAGKPCGRHAFEVHHLIPAERGGRAVMSNLITVCHECHSRAPGHEHMRKPRR